VIQNILVQSSGTALGTQNRPATPLLAHHTQSSTWISFAVPWFQDFVLNTASIPAVLLIVQSCLQYYSKYYA
jgi:hypothetical protein